MDILGSLEKQSKSFLVIEAFSLTCFIGVFDFITGYELGFSLFYVLPISLIAWRIGLKSGLAFSLVSAVVWLLADIASEHVYSNAFFPIWNTLIRLSFFIIITYLLFTLRLALEREKELAHTDHLTGAFNSRLFFEFLRIEMDRSKRNKTAFSLVYIDLDNFKTVNDTLGHSTGDQVLKSVVHFFRKHLRETDVTARLGGDEFALLLPETGIEESKVVLGKLHDNFQVEMNRNNWPITLSMGSVTCEKMPSSIDTLLNFADELMYSVKHKSKNSIKYSVYPEGKCNKEI